MKLRKIDYQEAEKRPVFIEPGPHEFGRSKGFVRCPFCGSPARLSAFNDGPIHYAYATIECGKCPARMTHDTYTMPGAKLPDLMEAVVANWNRRAEPKKEEEARDAKR